MARYATTSYKRFTQKTLIAPVSANFLCQYLAPVRASAITNNDLYNIVPMAWPISTVDLPGKELIRLLEENLERTWSADPFHQLGGLRETLQRAGHVREDREPAGTRIQDLFVGGERVKLKKPYRAAFVSLETVPENYGTNRKNIETSLHDATLTYLSKRKPANAELRGARTLWRRPARDTRTSWLPWRNVKRRRVRNEYQLLL